LIDKARQYIQDVESGKRIAGRYEKLAVKRHLNDLKKADKKGWLFSEEEAEDWLMWVSSLKHTKDKWAGKPFNPHPWQCFVVYCRYGWLMKETMNRRFRKSYISVSRKNGKSEFEASLASGHLLFDGVIGAEVYTAATNLTQAKYVYTPASAMIKMLMKQSKSLRKACTVSRSVNNPGVYIDGDIPSFMVPLTKNPEGNEGSNPSYAAIDELHLHPDSSQVDMLETGMGTRENPMLSEITTRGFDTSSYCYQFEQVVINILEGTLENDRLFGIIFSMDPGDDWKDPINWEKANPGIAYGTPSKEYLLNEYQKAITEGITKERAFRVKNLNQWWDQSLGWISSEIWKQGSEEINYEDLRGRPCYIGLDLAATSDFTAACLLFPPNEEDHKFTCVWRYYCPDAMVKSPKRNMSKTAYMQWANDGWITTTDGNVIDYEFIENDIINLAEEYDIKCLGYDRHRFYLIMAKLQEHGIKIEPVPQTFSGLSAPMTQIEILASRGMIRHGGNPVTDWNLSNVVVMMDSNENIKIDREKKKDKIDGIAAMIDAFNVFLKFYGEDEPSLWAYMAKEGILLT